jgi:Zn-dependent protease
MRLTLGRRSDNLVERPRYVEGVSERLGGPAQRNDPGTIRVGSLGGVDVLVRSSWFLIAALIAYLVAPGIERVQPGLGSLKYVAGAAFAVLLTLSLLLHELSHALMSQRFGINVRSITLHFIGGVTAMESEPTTPKQEFAISAIGPATSLGVAGAAYAVLQVTPAGLLAFVVGGLAWANLVVGVLNLVPGMPLDGGRILRAAVWKVSGDPNRGLSAAGWAGRGVALLMLASPLLMTTVGLVPDPFDFVFAVIIGWFLWSAASGAILAAKVRARMPRLDARRLARRSLALAEDVPVAEAVRQARDAQAGSIITLDHAGRPSGLVSEEAVLATPEERRAWVPVSAVSRSLQPDLSLPADIAGEQLVTAMARRPASEYLLVEPDGSVFGVLVASDVDAAFSRE